MKITNLTLLLSSINLVILALSNLLAQYTHKDQLALAVFLAVQIIMHLALVHSQQQKDKTKAKDNDCY